MKYKSPITYHSKDMANVKVFAETNCPQSFDTGHKNHGIDRSLVIRDIHMKYESLITYH
jgi:hypothetical protein